MHYYIILNIIFVQYVQNLLSINHQNGENDLASFFDLKKTGFCSIISVLSCLYHRQVKINITERTKIMKIRFSKLLSSFLAVLMLISCFSVFALAEDVTITVVEDEIPYGQKTVQVTWTGVDASSGGWVGLYTAAQYAKYVNDPSTTSYFGMYLAYEYLSSAVGGVLTLPQSVSDDRYTHTSIDIREDFPIGEYYAVIFINGGYTFGAAAPFEIVEATSSGGEGGSVPEPSGDMVVYLDPVEGLATNPGTQDAPVESINTAIGLINNAGVASATISVSNRNEYLKYAAITNRVGHDAVITYTTWFNTEGSSAKAQLIFNNVLDDAGTNGYISGPSIFDNIDFIDQTDNNNKYITLEGHDATFMSNVQFYHWNANNTTPAFQLDSSVRMSIAGVRNAKGVPGDGATFHVYNAGTANGQIDTIETSSYVDNSTIVNFIHFTDNVNVFVEGGTLGAIILDCTNSTKTAVTATTKSVYDKNVSIILNDGATLKEVKNDYATVPVVKGALQFVVNKGSTLDPAKVTANIHDANGNAGAVYRLNVDSADINLGVANGADTGVFTVAGDKIAYAVSADGHTVYYGAEELVIPRSAAGTYTVYAADSVNDIIAVLSEPVSSEAGYEFSEWKVGDTTITAQFTFRGSVTKDYYVVYGGAGTKDGKSVENAAASIEDVVELVNADGLTVGDTANVYVIDYVNTEDPTQNWNYYGGGEGALVGTVKNSNPAVRYTQPHHITPWAVTKISTFPEHKATLNITSYDYKNTGVKHLAVTPNLGDNYGMYFSGPVNFENIAIVHMRVDYREFNTRGYDVSFGDGTIIQKINYSDIYNNGTNVLHGKIAENLVAGNHNLTFGSSYEAKTYTGGTVTVKYSTPKLDKSRGIAITGFTNSSSSFTDRLTLIIDNAEHISNIIWGTSQTSVIDKLDGGLDIVVENAKELVNKRWDTFATVSIKNGLQILLNNGTSITGDIPDNVNADKTWIMKSEDKTGNKLELTDTIGSFAVVSEKTAAAVDADGKVYLSEDGVLTVDPGEYTISYIEAAEIIPLYFDGVQQGNILAGGTITLPVLSDTIVKEFSGWNDGTTDYAAGTSYTHTTGTEIRFTSLWKDFEDTVAVFVDQAKGADTNDGKTEATAFKTLGAAMDSIKDKTETNKIVAVIGDANLPASSDNTVLSKHDTMITVMGVDENARLIKAGFSFDIGGPTTFKNITFHHTVNSKFVQTETQPLVIGEGIRSTSDSGISADLSFHIGTFNKDGGFERASFASPVATVRVGAYYNTSDPHSTAGAVITINKGGNVAKLSLGADGGWLATHRGTVFTDTVSIVVNEGGVIKAFEEIPKGSTGDRTTYYENAPVQIINNAGTIPATHPFTTQDGIWIMSSTATDGALVPTDTAGTFEVVGGLTAVATDSDGGKFVSASGVLRVPAGKYTVTYTDVVYYTNTGKEISFYQDYELDITSVYHSDIEGKFFIGWVDSEGNGVTTSSFKDGDVLTAVYADFDAQDDFYIRGAQIRTSDPQGLRFITYMSKAIDSLPGNITYGSVILPADYVGTKDLVLGGKYTYNSTEYTAVDVPAVNIFEDKEDYREFTVCVTDISEEYYRRLFMVKGYVTYTDLNGVDRVLYTDYYSTNNYNIAEAAAADPAVSPEDKAYFESIVENVKEQIKEEYLSQAKIDIVGTSADKTTWIYQLEDCGVMVREADIIPNDYVEGVTDREPVEIVQVTDLHFNYVNERDFAEGEKYPEVIATYAGRTWGANGSFVPNAVRSLEYASFADQIVVTGDVLDYISWGCIELTKKHIFDPYPTALVTLGNHESTRSMQTKPSTPDSEPLAERLKVVEDNWIHDAYYHSKIVKDRVMVIGLENGIKAFWDVQIDQFAADLELAREKGYTVLLFYHVPIATNDPKYADIYPIRRNDTNNTNFYTGDRCGSIAAEVYNSIGTGVTYTDASREIYRLIVSNGDIIKGAFCGHYHSDYYTEILAKKPVLDNDGNFVYEEGTGKQLFEDAKIPQYVLTGTPYDKGHALKITVK